MNKFPPASTPDYCPFSVEVEPSSSHSFEHLRLSTVNKSWSLAMRTTSFSNLKDIGDSEEKDDIDAADEFPLNEMETDIERALSNEKAPVGLVPISSDSESSSRDESLDIDSDDDDGAAVFPLLPSTPRSSHLHGRHLPCDLSPRLSRTPASAEAPPLNPLNPLKVLNPGIPHGHTPYRPQKRYNTVSGKPRVVGTPKRGDSNTLVTVNSNGATTSAADCMCFAIEDVTQFFCPVTPRSMIDTTNHSQPGLDCFPAYDQLATSAFISGGSFPSIQDFWASPKNSPLPMSREQFQALFLLDANLPRNRTHTQRRKHVRKLLSIWHGAEDPAMESFGCRDDFFLADKRQRRRKKSSVAEPKCCYDSDPEQEVRGRSQRFSSFLSSSKSTGTEKQTGGEGQLIVEDDLRVKQKSHFRKFCPEPFTHLDTDEETDSEDDESSYETAKCAPTPSHPATPKNSDTNISFDFGKTITSVNVDGETGGKAVNTAHRCGAAEELNTEDAGIRTGKGHRRERSTTSLSTTGHSRFHTIRISPAQMQEGSTSDSSQASSAEFSSMSGSTNLHCANNSAGKEHQLPSYFKAYPTHWTEFQLLFSRDVEEESVKSHVHELSNVRFPLVWHPGAMSTPSNSKKADDKAVKKVASNSNIHCPTSVKIASLCSNSCGEIPKEAKPESRKGTPYPISVHGTFEVGAHLEHMVVQPKFSWTPLTQPHRIEDENDANHRQLFLSGSAPPQVELLSIIRVNKAVANQLDKNLYPYARAERTCIVSTNDANHPTIVLEARSIQERDWLIFSLKLIVARLASIIITRDEDMLHEFFSPYSALMQLEEEDSSRSERTEKSSSTNSEASDTSNIECAATPTATCGKAVVVIDGEGSNKFVFPQEVDEEVEDDESSTDSDLIVDDDEITVDDLAEVKTDDDDDIAFQDRDNQGMEDSIRARNSGAYAILKRSLTATGPLVEYEETPNENMQRTFSY